MDRTAFLLRELLEQPQITQRALAERLSLSLGSVNALLADASAQGLTDPAARTVTEKGLAYLQPFRMDGAVIMAAGFGSRFVPLTYDIPKGLLKVYGERMVERQIRQLQEAGITDITLVVGYLKEKFEYLIDKFGVKLLYNPWFETRNNISTVYAARHLLKGRNMYLLSSDNWMRDNLFHLYEPGAWYSAVYKEGATREWALTCSKKGIITDVSVGGENVWVMYGPVCLSREFSEQLLPALEQEFVSPGKEQYYWENVYIDLLHQNRGKRSMPEMAINRQPDDIVYEFENLDELRIFDPYYQDHSDNEAMKLIARVFGIHQSEIREIQCLKAGMTNQSFLFTTNQGKFICRIPGVGTDQLIDRKQEADNYHTVAHLDISEKVLYIDPETGYKISEYYEGSRNADPESAEDMRRCMQLVRRLHESGVTVDHSFDLRERIDFYEKICLESGGIPFEDYAQVRGWMNDVLDELDALGRPKVLAHVDSVATNFLFIPGENGESLRLIDWEYAGMADPLLDIAMCAIYSYYTKEQAEQLTAFYFGRRPTAEEQRIVFRYMALGGFLWALWAVYKSNCGKSFGDYTLIMYRYGKDFRNL